MAAALDVPPTPQFVAQQGQDVALAGDFVLQIVTAREPDPKVLLEARAIQEHLNSMARGLAGRPAIVELQGRADGSCCATRRRICLCRFS